MSDVYSDLARQFDVLGVVTNYVKGRPAYTQEPINWMLEQHCRVTGQPSLVIAEAGIGTGLFTQTIVAVANTNARIPSIAKIYGFDPSDQMCQATQQHQYLQNAISCGLLIVKNGKLQKTSLADHSVDVVIAAQTLHWGTQNEVDFQASVIETLRILKEGGSVFAVYNAPVADKEDSFTSALNALLANKCPYPYYQTLASGRWGDFLGEKGGGNLAKFFNEIAERGDGKVLQAVMENPTRYADSDTIKSYVFSNAFLHDVAINQLGFKEELVRAIEGLFEKYDNGSGVLYGNKTLVIGVVGLRLDG